MGERTDAVAVAAAPVTAPVGQFLDELARQRRLSAHTVAAYSSDLAELARLAGDTPLPQLHAADVRRALARLHGRGAAPASLARKLSAWRRFFDWLGARGEIAGNPAIGIRAPRRAKRLPKALAPDQAVQLAAHAPQATPLALRDKAMVELLYSSGLRLSELIDLDWRYFAADEKGPGSTSWLDLAAKRVTVLGKGGKVRQVPVGGPAIEALRQWLQARAAFAGAEPRAMFVSAQGRRIGARSVQARLARLAARLGLGVHVHPHVLRHSMASHVLQSSGDLRAVQELLGHASIATTQIYTRLDWQHLAKTYDAAHPRARRKSG
jgi:integrase/recombinase XerC